MSESRTTARASPARFCIPPEISAGYLSAAAVSSTDLSARRTRTAISRSGRRVHSSSGSATFSATVIHARSAPPWKRYPMRPRSFTSSESLQVATSMPSTTTLPEVGVRRRTRCLSVTDLPVPDGPTMQSTSPFSTENETPFRTGTPLNFFTTSRNSISLLNLQLNLSISQPLYPSTSQLLNITYL